MLLLKVMTTCLLAQMSVRGKAIFFETQWAVKLWFSLENFATCKLEGWAKSVQKEGAKKDF